VSLFSPPGGRSGAPRFRPVSTRRRVTSVATVFGLFTGIGCAAWVFGVNASSGGVQECAEKPVVVVPDKTLVNVYNSTIVTGLATQAADALAARGFRIGDVRNDPEVRKLRGTGELRYGPAGETQVAALRAWAPGMQLTLDKKRSGPTVDFVLGMKYQKLNDKPVAVVPPESTCEPEAA
jgi:hypothetical protein